MTSASVTRVNSSQININTYLNIKATSANPILANSKITFNIPFDQAVFQTDLNSLTFFQLDTSDNVGSALTATSRSNDSNYIYIAFNEWCSSGGNSCPENTQNIGIQMTGFKNPSTTLPPSNSFRIFVDSSSNLKIDSIESSLLATPSIQAGPLTNVAITRDTNVVGTSNTYTVTFTTTNSLTETNGIFLSFTAPAGLLYNGTSLACTHNGTASSSCPITTSTSTLGQQVTEVKVKMTCTTCAVGTYNVTFTGLLNPYTTQPPTGTITVATQGFDGSQYYNNDVLDIVIETTATALQTLTPGSATGTAVRSVTTINTNTEIT